MKKKLATISLSLLLSGYSYSQSVSIDNRGDTLVTITIQQMDNIYIELIEKDSLLAQSKISISKELKYVQLLDSADKDIKLLKTSVNSFRASIKSKDAKIVRSRNFGILGICMAIVAIIVK